MSKLFIWKFLCFGGKMFSIFEYACLAHCKYVWIQITVCRGTRGKVKRTVLLSIVQAIKWIRRRTSDNAIVYRKLLGSRLWQWMIKFQWLLCIIEVSLLYTFQVSWWKKNDKKVTGSSYSHITQKKKRKEKQSRIWTGTGMRSRCRSGCHLTHLWWPLLL